MTPELNFVYAAQIEEFQSNHRMILYKPRLSARSRVGIADRANEAVSLMKRLGLERTHIIVWGDTGSAAYYLAKRWPEKCRSIVFIGLADKYAFPQPFQFLLRLLSQFPIEGCVPSRVSPACWESLSAERRFNRNGSWNAPPRFPTSRASLRTASCPT